MARSRSKIGTDTPRLNEAGPVQRITDPGDQFLMFDASLSPALAANNAGSARKTDGGPASAASSHAPQPSAVAPPPPDWLSPGGVPTVRMPSEGEFNFTGTAAANSLLGTAIRNIARGLDGNDTLRGEDGDDILLGNRGVDILDGGNNNDLLIDDDAGSLFGDQLSGGAGDDTLVFHGGLAGSPDLGDGGSGRDFAFVDLGDSAFGWRLANEGGLVVRRASDSSSQNVIQLSNFELIGVLFGAGDDFAQTGDERAFLRGADGRDQLFSEGGDDFLDGGTGDDLLDSGNGLDWLSGGIGNDILDGGLGNDIMIGGAGDDTYNIDSSGDFIEEVGSNGFDTIRTSVGYALGAGVAVEVLRTDNDLGTTSLSLAGNELDNRVIGNAGINALWGLGGNDVLEGLRGDDTYVVDSALDRVLEAIGGGTNDTVFASVSFQLEAGQEIETLTPYNSGGTETLNLTGNEFSQIIFGNAGDNRIEGGGGADRMRGMNGNDTYIVDSADDVVFELGLGGIDQILSSVTYTLSVEVENLILTGAAAIDGTGNASANIVRGNAAANVLRGESNNDLIEGGGGADTLDGGTGADVFFYRNVSDSSGGSVDTITNFETGIDKIDLRTVGATSLAINTSGGISTVTAGTATGTMSIRVNGPVSATDVLLSGSSGGNSGNDNLTGTSGNDRLDGGPGADTMAGGLGNDIYVVDNAGDVVVENAGAGTDTVESSVSYTLGANVENLTLTGSGAINGAGNDLVNILIGNAAANVLDGGAGNDLIEGGGGADSLTGGSGADVFVYRNVSDSTGTAIDTITGFEVGVDKVDLRAVGATAVGGAIDNGLVTISIQTPTGTMQIRFSNSIGGGVTSTDFILATSNGGGTSGNDTLTGTSGDDRLDGLQGADTMTGGLGNDTYVVDNAGDTVVENAGEGTDTVESSISYTLGANVENLTLTGSGAINGTGNELGNVLIGNAAANTLIGAAGNDILEGGGGADSLTGGTGADTFVYRNVSDSSGSTIDNIGGFETGVDKIDLRPVGATGGSWTFDGTTSTVTVQTPTGTMTIRVNGEVAATDFLLAGSGGNGGNDVVQGTSGNDRLDGGPGADTMSGGLGNDTYVVDNGGDQVIENANAGTDTVESSVSHTLFANVENLTLTGTAAINGTGNELDNVLIGNAAANTLFGLNGNDVFEGGGGADFLAGASGADTFVYRNVSDSSGSAIDDIVGFDTGVDKIDLRPVGATGVSWTVTGTTSTVTVQTPTGNMTIRVDGTVTLSDFLLASGGGNGGNDVVQGTSGDDLLDGGAGADTMSGGLGNDIYVVDNAGDTVVENSGAGTDTVRSSVTHTLAANVENLALTGAGDIDGTGNALANQLVGNTGDNSLNGAGGDDVIDADGGDDVIEGGAGADSLAGGTGADIFVYRNVGDSSGATIDTINGFQTGIDKIDLRPVGATGVGWVVNGSFSTVTVQTPTGTMTLRVNGQVNAADFLLASGGGNSGNDNIQGTAADDRLDGGPGADTMAGGLGNDTYIVDNVGDSVIEAAGAGNDTVQSSVSFTLGANVENLQLTGTAAINGTGNGLANILIGNGAANILDGGAGGDVMQGGLGNDTYVIDDVGELISEAAGGGTDTVLSSLDYALAANLENLTLTGTAAINGSGNGLANRLTGNEAANLLDGGTGADTMIGGLGNDIYIVDNGGDVVSELAGGGTDTVESSVTFALGANVENLVLTGAGAINGTGNGLANSLTGNSSSNVLDGKAGADTMQGGMGNDTYFIDHAGDQAIETSPSGGTDKVYSSLSYILGSNVENLILSGAAAVNGTGNGFANLIYGNNAANILNGGAGADIMQGGLGNDTYVVDNVSDKVVETSAAGGIDQVNSSVRFALGTNVENLTLTGSAAINGIGNNLANVLTGNAGANVLNGAAGADTMAGGNGNDHYVVDNVGDTATETSAAGGTDKVTSTVSFTLGANVENLILAGSAAINGTGNGLANLIFGNAGANVLDGGAGADTLQGGLGSDTYVVDNLLDKAIETSPGGGTDLVRSSVTFALGTNVENLILTGSAGINGTGNNLANALTGNAGANVLKGLNGNDVIDGGAGDDQLQGGAGNDSLNGGTGADAFVFNSLLSATTNVDTILDFVHAIDEIQLDNAAFTGLAAGALNANAFRLGTAALDADDRILYDAATGALYFDRDGTGAIAAVQFATLDNMPANLNASDFLVI